MEDDKGGCDAEDGEKETPKEKTRREQRV